MQSTQSGSDVGGCAFIIEAMETTDHDQLFKQLLSTFFLDFLDLFFPEVLTYLEPDSLIFVE
jgi:hypothetical protein